MKGSKRDRWLKDGIKTSRKWLKSTWNRKTRHSKISYSNCSYKKIVGQAMWIAVP